MKRLIFIAALCCASMAQATLVTGFSGNYAVSNWTSSPDTGSIDTSLAPDFVRLTSGDDSNSAPILSFTSFYIQFLADATVTFRWDYATSDADPFGDPFGYVLADTVPDLLAGFSQLTVDGGSLIQTDIQSVVVSAGQYFGFATTSDNQAGPAFITLSNLRIEQVPEPGSVALLAAALAAAAVSTRRRRPA